MSKKHEQRRVTNKEGQVTVFVIIAIFIFASVVSFYLLKQKTFVTKEFDEKNPHGFIDNCMSKKIRDTVWNVSIQGGSVYPELYLPPILYDTNKVEFLCFSYTPMCEVRYEFLKEHIQYEIKNEIANNVVNCFNELKKSYEDLSYKTSLETGETGVEISPERIPVIFTDYTFTASKVESQRYDSFEIVLNNNLHDLAEYADKIVKWEAEHGEITYSSEIYGNDYPDIEFEKRLWEIPHDCGMRIIAMYTLTDKILRENSTGDKFQFATQRCIPDPPS